MKREREREGEGEQEVERGNSKGGHNMFFNSQLFQLLLPNYAQ